MFPSPFRQHLQPSLTYCTVLASKKSKQASNFPTSNPLFSETQHQRASKQASDTFPDHIATTRDFLSVSAYFASSPSSLFIFSPSFAAATAATIPHPNPAHPPTIKRNLHPRCRPLVLVFRAGFGVMHDFQKLDGNQGKGTREKRNVRRKRERRRNRGREGGDML